MRKSNIIISAAILGVLAVGSIAAYFTATDEVTNRLPGRDLHILLLEPSWDADEAKLIVPNKKIEKDPYIQNTASTDAFVFLTLCVPYADDVILEGNGTEMYKSYIRNDAGELISETNTANGAEVVIRDEQTGTVTRHYDAVELFRFFQENDDEGFNSSDWSQLGDAIIDTEAQTVTYIFSYGASEKLSVLQAGERTSTLFDYVKFVNIQEGQGYEPVTKYSAKNYHVTLHAYGIQIDYLGLDDDEKNDPQKVWQTYCAKIGVDI